MRPVTLLDSDIVVVGVGAATAIGQGAPSTAAAVRAGIAGFSEHPYMIDARGEPFLVAMAPYLDPVLDTDLRMIELGRMAANEACASLARNASPAGLSLFVGLPSPRPGLSAPRLDEVAVAIGGESFTGFRVDSVQTLPYGHSAGLMAIGAGCRALREGLSSFALACGIDSHIGADTLEWLDEVERLHIPDNAWGFMPGEAAGFCMLCTAGTAIDRQFPVLGKVAAMSTSDEPNRIYTETICLGQGLTKAVQRVVGFLPDGVKIDATYCDQNGEAYRADECGFMLTRSSERFVDPTDFATPADCWGDVGAASGPLFAMLAAVAARKGYAKGACSLLWTSSDSGERSALLFEAEPLAGPSGDAP